MVASTIKVPKTLKLDDIARAFAVHPRTILRYIKKNVGAYWAKGYNPDIDTQELSAAMNADLHAVVRAINGSDELLSPKEASEYLQIPFRTFTFRGYKAAVRVGKTVRYSSIDIANEHIDSYLKM